MIKDCLVKGCPNRSDQGIFEGDLCLPCHRVVTTGVANHGDDFISEALRGRDAAYRYIGRLICSQGD